MLGYISKVKHKKELKAAENESYELGHKDAERYYKEKIESLEDKVVDFTIAEKAYKRKLKALEAQNDALESDRDDVREIASLEMKLADKSNELDTRKELLDEKQSKLKEREAALETKEEANYKNGYADGVADGLREISDITQKDRDNAMKIAMVAAASHTPIANLREVNGAHQIGTGDTDEEG